MTTQNQTANDMEGVAMFPLAVAQHCSLIAEQRQREAAVHRRPRRPKEARRPTRPVWEV